MSLVAYDNSDESESDNECDEEVADSPETKQKVFPSSDSERVSQTPLNTNNDNVTVKQDKTAASEASNNTQRSPEKTVDPHISDEEDDVYFTPAVADVSSGGLKLPAPKYGQAVKADTGQTPVARTDNVDSKSSLLLGLPVPKPATQTKLTVLPPGDDELEEMVKPKAAELASREKPPPKKKIIKIAAPALADYDSDEDEPDKKKLKSSKKGSGLFALLPEPKNVTKKEVGRVLIPHTLTKKPAVPKPAAKPVTQLPKAQLPKVQSVRPAAAVDYDSDPDDDAAVHSGTSGSVNFFSIGTEENAADSTTDNNKWASLSASSYSVTSSLSSLPPVSRKTGSGETSTDPDLLPSTNSQFKEAPLTFKNSDAPLQFKRDWNPMYEGPQQGPDPYTGPGTMTYAQQSMDIQEYNVADMPTDPETGDAADSESMVTDILPPEEMLRLQGKRQWGKEAINFIDIKADHKADSMQLTKNLTEQVDMHTHSRKNRDLPSRQQKRKHQITYLAHQAKEREFDLKNQWANNRLTKQQTQSKYGF